MTTDERDFIEVSEMLGIRYDALDQRGSVRRLLDKLDRLDNAELARLAMGSKDPFDFMIKIAVIRSGLQDLIAKHVGN